MKVFIASSPSQQLEKHHVAQILMSMIWNQFQSGIGKLTFFSVKVLSHYFLVAGGLCQNHLVYICRILNFFCIFYLKLAYLKLGCLVYGQIRGIRKLKMKFRIIKKDEQWIQRYSFK